MSKWRRKKSLPRRWQRSQLINQYGNVCYLCNNQIPKLQDITIDHWMPISKGGIDEMSNYRLAHDRCNKLKGDLTPDAFRDFQEGSIEFS